MPGTTTPTPWQRPEVLVFDQDRLDTLDQAGDEPARIAFGRISW